MRNLSSVLFWSVVAAAFIGPGTVTTAATAGSTHGTALLWTLLFSTLACFLLQEMAARSRLATGLTLGERIRQQYPRPAWRGLLAAAIVTGGIAYEAGNLLGALLGLQLIWPAAGPWLRPAFIIAGSLGAALILWRGTHQALAKGLGALVAGMGLLFVGVAAQHPPPAGEILRGSLIPTIPADAGWLVLGLIGTTIVPYNLFLGGSIVRQEDLGQMRIGLGVAIGLGGLVSMAVLLVGMQVAAPFSFPALGEAMSQPRPWAGDLVGLGLLAAGLSSAITAPWAAALTVQGLFPSPDASAQRFRLTWAIVLLAGLGFGGSGLRPVPVIILAQALNAFVLPLVAIFLLRMMNDRAIMGALRNGRIGNLLGLLVIAVTLILGGAQLGKLLGSFF